MFTVHLLKALCLGCFSAWLVLSAWVLVNRVLFDRRARLERLDSARLIEGSPGVQPSRRRLLRLAVADQGAAAAAAARALIRIDAGSLFDAASRSGGGTARNRALRILARGGSPDAVALLRAAIGERNPAATGAAVGIVSEIDSPAADALLLEVLVAGDHPRSRTATELEPRAAQIRAELLATADSDDPTVRYWALTLLERVSHDREIESTAMRRAGDDDPRVRAAAAQLLAHATGEPALESVQTLMHDDVFFVRAHAARAVGALGAGHLAGELSELLADSNWWVRAATREGLVALGPAGVAAAVDALDHTDRFARDGARDVILAWDRLHRPADETGGTEAAALLEEIRRRRPDLGEPRAPRPSPWPVTRLESGKAAG